MTTPAKSGGTMTTTNKSTLPPVRNLAAYGFNETEENLPEDYYREIEDAICAGTVRYTTCGSDRPGDTPKKEVAVTRFRDPRADEIRHAVEIWNDGRSGKYDYADHAEANRQANEWVRLIGIHPTGR
ncbi:hypothetical protein [Streptomyces sp. NPDC056670]|uniref:hypothetical protein n=1 Tax=Streptomyces sp. NPDC056670 TaxID=3345904 RepID=UPI00367AB16C